MYVVAIVVAKPGLRARVLEFFEANVPAVRMEKGCLAYQATVDLASTFPVQTRCGEDAFVVLEKWATVEDWRLHASAAHMLSYRAATQHLVTSRIVHLLQDAAGVEVS